MNIAGAQAAVAPIVDGKVEIESSQLVVNPYEDIKVGDNVYMLDGKILKEEDIPEQEE